MSPKSFSKIPQSASDESEPTSSKLATTSSSPPTSDSSPYLNGELDIEDPKYVRTKSSLSMKLRAFKNKTCGALKCHSRGLRVSRRKNLLITALVMIVLFVVFRYYHTNEVSINQWRYHDASKDIRPRDILNTLHLSDEKLAKLKLEYSELPSENEIDDNDNTKSYNSFDQRLPASLYVAQLSRYLESHRSNVDPTLTLQFSWKDWTDFDKRLLPGHQFLSMNNGYSLESCSEFIRDTGFTRPELCKDLTDSEVRELPNPLYPHFKITGICDPRISKDARVLIAATYLYHSMDAPKRILILDSGRGRALSVRLENSKDRRSILTDYVSSFKAENSDSKKISLRKQMRRLNNAMDGNDLMRALSHSKGIDDLDVFKVVREDYRSLTKLKELKPESFEWNSDSRKLKNSLEKKLNQFEKDCQNKGPDALECDSKYSLTHNLDEVTLQTLKKSPNGRFDKFFHEAGYFGKGMDNGAHFDWRFFGTRKLSEYELDSALHKMMRTWLRFSQIAGIDTWIAHGSLLGYYFNGLSLPWDFDHDVQVTQESLVKLAKSFNQTLVVDGSLGTPDDAMLSDIGMGDYFIDVGPSYYYREKGNGNNAIDARFIDIHTGLFIDITSLSTDKHKPNTGDMGLVLSQEYKKFLKQNRASGSDYKKFVSDRNSHNYELSELSPLIPTLFEGEKTFIPQKINTILSREYMKYRENWSFEHLTWRTRYGQWISDKTCRKFDREGNSCSEDPSVKLDDLLQRSYINKHIKLKDQLNSAKDVVKRTPSEVEAYPRVLRPDTTLMKIAMNRFNDMNI